MNVAVSELKEHPFSKEVFEDLPHEDYEALKTDVQMNGIKIPLDILLDKTLLDGHQRKIIAIELGLKTVPCQVRKLRGESEVKEWIILANLLRRQLAPTQKAVAVAKLSEIYEIGRGQHLKEWPRDKAGRIMKPRSVSSTPLGLDVLDKVAEKTGLSRKTVGDYRTYARAIKEYPELKECGRGAVQSVVIEYRRRKEIGKRKRMLKNAPELKNLILGDTYKKVNELPNNSIDVLLTDPPYGTGYRTCRGETERIRGQKWATIEGDTDEFFVKFECFLRAIKPKLKENAHLYIFTSWKAWHRLRPLVDKHYLVLNCIVWDKGYPALGELQGYNYRDVYELVLFATNNERRKMTWKGWSEGEIKPTNIIRCTNPKRSSKTTSMEYHPTVKPTELLKRLIAYSSVENETICDPFCGSGSTLVAAEELGRNWIGIEIDKHWYDVARARIHELRKNRGVVEDAES